MKMLLRAMVCCVILGGVQWAHASVLQDVTIEWEDGTWRGQLGDELQVVYLDGRIRKSTSGTLVRFADGWLELTDAQGNRIPPIYAADLVTITQSNPSDGGGSAGQEGASAENSQDASQGDEATDQSKASTDGMIHPTFYLPLSGQVGVEFRAEEIEAITAQADELGPGQTIVLHIDSGGGYVAEWMMIRDAIFEAQKRHRVVAWILEAGSAASMTSICCDVIVMKPEGWLGSSTTIGGSVALTPAQQVQGARDNVMPCLRRTGRTTYLAIPIKTGSAGNLSELSYTIDPDTGQVEWFQSLDGETIVSRPPEVLKMTARQAVDSKLAIGMAKNEEELGILLDQGGWKEVGTGRKLHDDWHATVKRCQKDLQVTGREFQKLPNDQAGIRKRIAIVKRWLRWYRDAANVPTSMSHDGSFPSKSALEKMLEDLEFQLRLLRDRDREG